MYGHCFREQVLSLCPIEKENGNFANIQFEGNSLNSLRQLIRYNSGYTLFPKLYQSQLEESEIDTQTRLFIPPIPTREISLVYMRHQWKQDILGALEQAVIDSLPPEIPRKCTKNMLVMDINR